MKPPGPPPRVGFPLHHIGLILLIQVVWGANFVVSKTAIADVPPLIFVTARFFFIWILLVPFMRWHPGQMLNVLAVAIFAGAGHFAFMIMGLAMADDVSPIAIALQLGPPFATTLSVIFLGERLGPWRLSALVISFGGVALVGFDPVVFQYWPALLMTAAAALAMAIATIFMRRTQGVPVYDMQGWIGLATWPVLLPLSLFFETDPLGRLAGAEPASWAAIAFTVLAVSLIGHAGLYWALQRHEITRIAPFLLMAPVIGAALGIALLGDAVTWRIVVGGFLTLAGVLIITIREGRKGPVPPPTSRT